MSPALEDGDFLDWEAENVPVEWWAAAEPEETTRFARGRASSLGRRVLRSEPLWYLRGLSYSAYTASDHWQLRRRQFLDAIGPEGRYCRRCGLSVIGEAFYLKKWWADPDGQPCGARKKGAERQETVTQIDRYARFVVHHLTYENVGCERDEDLQLLCDPCHNVVHERQGPSVAWWEAYLAGERDPDAFPVPLLNGEPVIPNAEPPIFGADV